MGNRLLYKLVSIVKNHINTHIKIKYRDVFTEWEWTTIMEYEDETREYDDTYEGVFAIELPSNTFKIYT